MRAAFLKSSAQWPYPSTSPFDPPCIYPEFSRAGFTRVDRTDASNQIYPMVRELLRLLELDAEHYGSPAWNPLGKLVKPGQRVLLKPNLVHHRHPKGPSALAWTISHPSAIRAVLDYVALAVGDAGRVVIGDAPIENCDFGALCGASGLAAMVSEMRGRGIDVSLIDFRTFQTAQHLDSSVETTPLAGDPSGYTDIDLAERSFFHDLEQRQGPQNYYTLGDHTVDHMDPNSRVRGRPNDYHAPGRHVYRIANSILDADCVVSLAKLKTHKFSGVTLSLKNAIGICSGKEYLPHRRPGPPEEGGDSFARQPSFRYVGSLRAKRALYRLLGESFGARLSRAVHAIRGTRLPHETYIEPLYGDWHGNDTIWRTTLDLNLILKHGFRDGLCLDRPGRPYLGLVEGVVGMDHEAPMAGLPVDAGLMVAGRDAVATDTLACFLMGFDPRLIPTINRAERESSALGSALLRRTEVAGNVPLSEARCRFVPTRGWADHLLGRTRPTPDDWPFPDQ